jgi:hypothetical protein
VEEAEEQEAEEAEEEAEQEAEEHHRRGLFQRKGLLSRPIRLTKRHFIPPYSLI